MARNPARTCSTAPRVWATSRANRSNTSQASSWGSAGTTAPASCVFELRADHMGPSLPHWLLPFGRRAGLNHPGRVHEGAELRALPDRVQVFILREFLQPEALVQGQSEQPERLRTVLLMGP